jgi:predicted kinase
LAPALAPSPGAIVIRSDVTRKALLGVPETTRLPEAAYSHEMHARVFTAMADRARAALKSGFSVILDGVYGSQLERDEAAAAARDAGTSFQGLWLEGSPATLEARVAARYGDASDATVSVLRRQLETVVSPLDWTHIDVNKSPSEALRAASDHLTALAS